MTVHCFFGRVASVLGALTIVLVSLMSNCVSAQAQTKIVTCPRDAPPGTDYVTVIVDLEKLETYDDDDGLFDETFEFRLFVSPRVFEFNAQGQQKRNPICMGGVEFKFDRPILSIINQGAMVYGLGYRIQISNVPKTAAVYLRFSLAELDELGDDFGDLDPSPNNDTFNGTWVALLPEKGVGIAYSTNVKDRPFDIQAGKRKRILGDGKGTRVDFKAGLEFTFTVKDQPDVGGAVAGATSPKVGGAIPAPGTRDPGLIGPGQALTSREDRCRDYALKSVEQNLESIKLGCNYPSPVWSNNHQAHFDWCMQGNNHNQAATEIDKRKVALATCAQGNSPDQVCRIYADRSVAQFIDGQNRGCDIAPPVWSGDWNAHFGWCMVVGGNTATPELAKRDKFLAACGN